MLAPHCFPSADLYQGSTTAVAIDIRPRHWPAAIESGSVVGSLHLDLLVLTQSASCSPFGCHLLHFLSFLLDEYFKGSAEEATTWPLSKRRATFPEFPESNRVCISARPPSYPSAMQLTLTDMSFSNSSDLRHTLRAAATAATGTNGREQGREKPRPKAPAGGRPTSSIGSSRSMARR